MTQRPSTAPVTRDTMSDPATVTVTLTVEQIEEVRWALEMARSQIVEYSSDYADDLKALVNVGRLFDIEGLD